METKSGIQWFLDKCETKIRSNEIVINAPSKIAAEGLRKYARDLSYLAISKGKRRALVYFPGDRNRPYIFPSCLALEEITDLYLNLEFNYCHNKERVLKMVANILTNAEALETLPLRGLVSDEWLKLALSVHQEQCPCFLVSTEFHKNIVFNQAALDLLNAAPKDLLAQSLPKLWVPQNQILPIDYEQKLPPQLTDFNTHLRQQSKLESFVFENWRSNYAEGTAIWTRWTNNIEYVELPSGGNARKMVVLGFEPVSNP